MPDGFPRFRSFTANLTYDDTFYEEIMQDVYVDKTGRYELVTEPHKMWDVKECCFHVQFDFIDNGPQT
jgi:hypothetical protein